ncbi:hypothetical protein [Phenylobacterium sp.]|uniref:hypothetical protein n=1 Tax=Phenylobacterium sp. TaxID=1871053 RepID=UPI00286AE525|nr:hypothetical protein [Phenylobacterium sp.]
MPMKILLIAAAAMACAAPPALAEPPAGIASTFGNTVMSIYPDGRSQKIWLKPDGSWTGRSRRGNPLAGKWSMRGEKVCLKQTSPAMPFSFCQVLPADPEVGLTSRDFVGTPIRLKLVKGLPK